MEQSRASPPSSPLLVSSPRLLAAVFTVDIPCLELLRSRVSLKRPGTDSCLKQPRDCESKLSALCLRLRVPLSISGSADMPPPSRDNRMELDADTAALLLDNEGKLDADTTCALHLCPLSSGFNCGFLVFFSLSPSGAKRAFEDEEELSFKGWPIG